MKWIKFNIDHKPKFDNYDSILVKITNPSICCEFFVCDLFSDGTIYSSCINHSQECGSHTIRWDEIDYWMPIFQPEVKNSSNNSCQSSNAQ